MATSRNFLSFAYLRIAVNFYLIPEMLTKSQFWPIAEGIKMRPALLATSKRGFIEVAEHK
jgi:hypothetical protein